MADIKYKEDFNLANRYWCGDTMAGQNLYAKIYPLVKGFIWNQPNAQMLPPQDKDDILLETMKISVEKIPYYNGQSSFYTYVCGIAKFKILDKNKENIKNIYNRDKIVEINEIKSIFDNPLEILIEKELLEAVSEAQIMLSPEHRDIMRLRLNGMKSKSIAEQFGFTVDAVNSMYYRAIKAFVRNFKKIYYNSDDF